MQAMNGSAGRGRLIGCCMALVLALSALVFAPTAGAVTHPTKTYLALGDSLAFGYTQVKHTENAPGDSPAFFEKGYTNTYAKKVRGNKIEDNKAMVEVNDGCPGETSKSFLGEGTNIGLGTNCNYQALFTTFGPGTAGGPLHNPYPGKSQASNMLQILKGGSPAHPITAISLNIGANDELAGVSACKAEVKSDMETKGFSEQPKGSGENYTTSEIPGAINACVAGAAPGIFFTVNKNIETIVGKIYGEGGYTGKVVLVGFFNPFTFILPGSDALQKLFNEYLEANVVANNPGKVVFANPFVKFNGTSEGSAAEQKKICTYTEMCNPTAIAENKAADEAKKTKEAGEGKTVIYPFNPAEGDIHPTEKGYALLGKVVYEALPV
jgi:lysophospholipase L1-like esterase